MSNATDKTLHGVAWEVTDGIGRLVLDRPEVLNALDLPMVDSITTIMQRVAVDEHVRTVVVSGRGRAFCAGADIGQPLVAEDEAPDPELLDAVTRMVLAIRRAPVPVIAMVTGPASGVGCSLALACDLVYASEDSYLQLAFANVGLMPDGGASLMVPDVVGRLRAAEMAMLAERVPAAMAVQWGLANGCHQVDQLSDAVDAVARRLADGPSLAHAATKEALNRRQLSALAEQLDFERDWQLQLMQTLDHREAVSAFQDKRQPRFRGR